MDGRKTIVLKVGSASLVEENTFQPKTSVFRSIARAIAVLRSNGHEVVLVSSGAVAIGKGILRYSGTASDSAKIKAYAAIGQTRLMAIWEAAFCEFEIAVAQVLMLNDNHLTSSSSQIGNTLQSLLNANVVPIVNENDAIAPGTFGGNDIVALVVAKAIKADTMVFLTDIDCLYTKNPRFHADAKPIEVVDDCETLSADVSSNGSTLGTGGMKTKIFAARIASSLGITTIINNVSHALNIVKIVEQMVLVANPYLRRNSKTSVRSDLPISSATSLSDLMTLEHCSMSLHTMILPAKIKTQMPMQQLIAVAA